LPTFPPKSRVYFPFFAQPFLEFQLVETATPLAFETSLNLMVP
jgi:hypothetical protein